VPGIAAQRATSDSIKEQISYVSTNGWMGLEWQLTAYENLLLCGHIFGLPRGALHQSQPVDRIVIRWYNVAATRASIGTMDRP
jgi:hypothetical protein